MAFSWLASPLQTRRRSADRRARQQSTRRRFALERFEDRTLLSNWIGAAAGDWNVATNWDAGIPSATNPATINGNVTVNVDIASASARSLTMSGGATLNLGGNALAVNTAGNAVADGLKMTGSTLTGGTGGTLNVGGNFTVDPASSFNVGDVTFKGVNTGTIDSTIAFNNVTIAYGGHHVTFAKPLDVNGALTITGYNTITGEIDASGSVTTSAPWSSNSSPNGTLKLDGSAPQTLTGLQGSDVNGAPLVGNLPKVVNAKTGNSTLTVTGAISPVNWTQVSGNLAAANSTTYFKSGYTSVDTGATSLGDVAVDVGQNHFKVKQLNVGGNLSIAGAQTFTRASGAPAGTTINVSGDVNSTATSPIAGNVGITMTGGGDAKLYTGTTYGSNGTGYFPKTGIVVDKGIYSLTSNVNVTTPLDGPLTIQSVYYMYGSLAVGGNVTTSAAANGPGVILFAGGANQTLAATIATAGLPGVGINKTGGTLTLPATTNVTGYGGWKVDSENQGTVNTGTGTVRFVGSGAKVDTGAGTGAMAFNNVEIAIGTNDLSVQKMAVDGDLTLTSVANVRDGAIYVKGNVYSSSNKATAVNGGAIRFVGDGDQSLKATNADAHVPSVLINKTGGTLTLDTNPIDVTGNWTWTWTQGAVINTGSTVRFVGGGAKVDTGAGTGAMAFNNVEIAIGTNDLSVANMVVDGKLTLTSVANVRDGAIDVKGNVYSSSNKARAVNGGAILFAGGGDQSLTVADGGANVPTVLINKPGGALTLDGANPINVTGNWTWTKGAVVNTGSTVRFVGNGAVINTGAANNAMKFNNVVVDLGNYNLDVPTGGKLAVGGDLTLSSVYWINAPSGAITVAGDLTSNDPSVGGDADITMVGNAPASITANPGDFPGGGIVVSKGSTTLIANVTTPIRGPLTFGGKTALSFAGILTAAGNVSTNQELRTNLAEGSVPSGIDPVGKVVFAGNKNQTLTATSAQGGLPGVEIAKTGGKLTINGFSGSDAKPFGVYGNWNVTDGNAGAVDATGATINFAFHPIDLNNNDNKTFTVNTGAGAGAMAFGNVVIVPASGSTQSLQVPTGGKMAVAGDLTVNKVRNIIGDVTMVGGDDATATYNYTPLTTSTNGGLVIDKSAGKKVALGANANKLASLNVLSGILDFAGYSTTVNGTVHVATGAGLAFTAPSSGGTQLSAGGDLTFDDDSLLDIDLSGIANSITYDLIKVAGAGKKLVNGGVDVTATGGAATVNAGTNGTVSVTKP